MCIVQILRERGAVASGYLFLPLTDHMPIGHGGLLEAQDDRLLHYKSGFLVEGLHGCITKSWKSQKHFIKFVSCYAKKAGS